ncbi:MAG: hypothetical protein A2V70_10665 [Planctomycetes bacterium RBG_13_63_9]|nr:MAG: hypothetical protein A2V70_10665 [Planctomycetes bacterium RBG_13_63_9]
MSFSSGGMNRRGFLRVGALGAMGLTLADWFRMKAHGAVDQPKAKSVIQLWMGGGPTHLDTFDPKPQAGDDYCGPYKKPVETNVPGMRICQMLPLLAKQADKYSIIRSMTHGNNGHEIATYVMQTGTMPSDLVYPSMGAVVAYKGDESGYEGSLPPYISLTSPLGRFSECGFLGTEYKTFATGGDPNADSVRVQGIVPPGGVTDQRLQGRRSLLAAVDSLAADMENNKKFEAMDSFQQRAYGLILGEAKKAFNMAEEKDEVRERYGRNRFGQSCLLARRLVEHGVPFITVNSGGWDTHRDNFGRMKVLLPPLDQGFSALLEDLDARGLLDSTIVTWFGEFGRTPKIAMEAPWDGGRHHYGLCMSAVVAGGGFRGGMVVGSSDAKGEKPKDRPVYPWDLSASMYTLLGIDPTGTLPHPHGCVAYVTPVASGSVQSGGLLSEVM